MPSSFESNIVLTHEHPWMKIVAIIQRVHILQSFSVVLHPLIFLSAAIKRNEKIFMTPLRYIQGHLGTHLQKYYMR